MKKLIAVLLTLSITFCLFPFSAFAADGGEDADWSDGDWDEPEGGDEPGGQKPDASPTVNGRHLLINGEYVTDEKLTVLCGEGKATFDPKSNTLTLQNAELTKTLSFSGSFEKVHEYGGYHPRAAVATDLPQLTMAVKGDNAFGDDIEMLLRAYGSVTFTGDGGVSAADEYASIEVRGDVAFQNAAITGRLHIHGGDQGYEPFGALTMKDSTLTNVDRYAGGDVTIANSTLEGEKREGQYYALNPNTNRSELREGVYYNASVVKYCGANKLTVTDSRVKHTNLYEYSAYVGAVVPPADLTLRNAALDTASLSAGGGAALENVTVGCTGRTETENLDRVNRLSAGKGLSLSGKCDLKYTNLESGGDMTLPDVVLEDGSAAARGDLTMTGSSFCGMEIKAHGNLSMENCEGDAKRDGQISSIWCGGDRADFINCDFRGIETQETGEEQVLLGNGMPMTAAYEYTKIVGISVNVYRDSEDGEPADPRQLVTFKDSRAVMTRISGSNDMRLTIDNTRMLLNWGTLGYRFDYDANVTLTGNVGIVKGYWGANDRTGIFIDYMGDYYTYNEETGEAQINNYYGLVGFRQRVCGMHLSAERPDSGDMYPNNEPLPEYADKVTKMTFGDEAVGDLEWIKNFTALKEVDFGDGNTAPINWHTFEGCTSLEKVTVGKNTEVLYNGWLSYCPSLKTVIIKSDKLPDWQIRSFLKQNWRSQDVTIYVPAGQVERWRSLNEGSAKISAIAGEPADPQPADYMPGDVDLDKRITAADARLALRRSVGLENYEKGSIQYRACDVDRDGGVSAADARLILRASVGLEDPKTWIG